MRTNTAKCMLISTHSVHVTTKSLKLNGLDIIKWFKPVECSRRRVFRVCYWKKNANNSAERINYDTLHVKRQFVWHSVTVGPVFRAENLGKCYFHQWHTDTDTIMNPLINSLCEKCCHFYEGRLLIKWTLLSIGGSLCRPGHILLHIISFFTFRSPGVPCNHRP